MGKIIKYAAAAIIGIAMILVISKYAGKIYDDSMNRFVDSMTAQVEVKRNELLATGVFHEGVTVNGVSIGGMTLAEAKAALVSVEEDLVKNVGFTLRYGDDGVFYFKKDYFSFKYDTDQVLAEAIMLASDGEYEAIRQEIDDIRENGRAYTITSTVIADEERMVKAIRVLGDSLFVEPVNACIVANPDSVFDDTLERITYKEGINGFVAKTDEVIEELHERIANEEYGLIYLELTVLEPEIKAADLEGSVVMRSRFTSSYASGAYGKPNRVFNIKKACGIVNGTLIPPKDSSDSSNKSYIFSINDALGPRTEALGWLMAPGFVNGGANSVDSPGGGVCHVSSTLYNAVVKADLKVVSRMNHSSHVGYVPWGLDATIDTRGPDFKFSNNTSSDIYVFMWVNESKKLVCCEIWGEPFPSRFDYIDFYAELVEEIPPTATQYIQTGYLSAPHWYIGNEAKTGYKYQSYKQYYRNGRKIGEPVPVATSEYKMHPKRIYVWRGFDINVDVLDPAHQVPPPKP
ncbi:MAG: VanW family protein [Clostridia bacterium]|nr:VanW family protein [Clostridia bacterium]